MKRALAVLLACWLAIAPAFAQNSFNILDTPTSGVTGGGTGLTTTTPYSPIFSGTTATGPFNASTGPGTAGQILTSNGAGAYPTWQAVSTTPTFPGTVSGATSGGIPYFTSTTGWASSALLGASAVVLGGGAGTAPFTDITNLVYTATGSVGGGPQLQVGNGSTTAAGFKFGLSSSGVPAIWPTNVTASASNWLLAYDSTAGGTTYLRAVGEIDFYTSAVLKMTLAATSGMGPAFTSGTAATDVAALSVTRTNNNAAVATGVKITFTDTTSAPGFLPLQVLGGASAVTNLLSVSKTGTLAVGAAIALTGYTVSTLPASPVQGWSAFVTDAVACTFLASLTGGGSAFCPVHYNGSAWVGG